tara:strand:- start:4443 stop:5579 length:1137 start_codon:yes stop_codon:yes gene_type:complete
MSLLINKNLPFWIKIFFYHAVCLDALPWIVYKKRRESKKFAMSVASFPALRLRRNRSSVWCRNLVAESILGISDLIWPVFIREAHLSPSIKTMPDVRRFSLEEIDEVVSLAKQHKIQAVAFFPVTAIEDRDEEGSGALKENGLLIEAIRRFKALAPDIGLITDVALDPYTSHGHDGILVEGEIHNDQTLEKLSRFAVLQAKAGADIIAPSDMMDGRIGTIRQALDDNGYHNVALLSYAAKYASCLYGPFREAVESSRCLGLQDKKTYQMDYRNSDEALREVEQDLQEGADAVMIKPATFYMDILHRVKTSFKVPTFAFHVSGEYTMLKLSASAGIMDYKVSILEVLSSLKRAGADAIITYAALDVAAHLLGLEASHDD